MRVNTKPRRRNAPRPAEKSAPAFLQWLRGRECAAASPNCMGRMEAAHVYGAGDKGMGTKNRDSHAIPLCSYHHRVQHDDGWLTFEREMLAGRRAPDLARAYWKVWPGRVAWEGKQNG